MPEKVFSLSDKRTMDVRPKNISGGIDRALQLVPCEVEPGEGREGSNLRRPKQVAKVGVFVMLEIAEG